MRKEKLEHLATTGMMKENAVGENNEKNIEQTNKEAKCKASDRCTKRNKGT